jgi:nitrate/TMAO reductase-like tetraheme cytochrome c subunit
MSDFPRSPTFTPAPKQSIWQNWISLSGAIVAVGSLFAFAFLFTMDLLGGGQKNPYLGILAYLVAPAFLIIGLALILGGAWNQRRNTGRIPYAPPPRFAIDLSRPRDRWVFIWFGAGALGFMLLTAVGSYQTFQYTESVTFCGAVCHTVMEPEYTTYKAGDHARVACVECHIGSGAEWYVRAKISGLHQVYAVAVNHFDRPIPTPVQSLRPARDTCEQCHWPQKYSGGVERVRRHFLGDDKNTPYTVRLLVNVGGGSPAHGPVGGIHWHMLVSNKVEYYASDTRRQTIPWVRVTAQDGAVTVYRTADFKGEPPPGEIRQMDCMDCHNRPSHKFETPDAAVDEAMYLGRIDSGLAGIKHAAVDLLTKPYSMDGDADAAIDKGLRSRYPAAGNIGQTAAAVQAIYHGNFFPEMKADWSKYPDNIGHLDSPGCFRCHDGKHAAVGGASRMLSNDCNSCHTILSQGSGADLAKVVPQGQPFRHPAGEIGGMGLICSDCHNGKNQDN